MTHEIVPLDDDLAVHLYDRFGRNLHRQRVRVNGVVLAKNYPKFSEAIENFQVRDDDVWVCSFPKTGTTWTQEMVWCILNDIDSEEAKVTLMKRFSYLELSHFNDFEKVDINPNVKIPPESIDSVSFIRDLPSPRYIKTHLPFHLLPRQLRNGETKAKIVYVTRNVKDTCISYYHQALLLEGFTGSFEDFCNLFIGDTLFYAPFWGHVVGFWKERINENLLFLKYEDMKEDLPHVIKKTASFFGKSLTNDQLSVLTDHLSFSSMKKNPAANNEDLVREAPIFSGSKSKPEGVFMRNGNSGQWKTVMTPEVIERFDEWSRECLKDTGLFY